MTRWYRAYVGTVSDDKIAEVAMIAECSRSVAIAIWHSVLESAASDENKGAFSTTPRRVAATLQERCETVDRVFSAMTELEMIADGAVCAWSKRQFESDSSTARSRKHRENKAKENATPMQRCATPPETETDTDIPEPNGSGRAEPADEPAKPVYSDAKHELWGEGRRMLAELGIPKSKAGALIGQWAKESGDDYAGVLDAIRRAREHKPIEPIPWIVRALPQNRKPQNVRQSDKLRSAFDKIDDYLRPVDSGGIRPSNDGLLPVYRPEQPRDVRRSHDSDAGGIPRIRSG